jgi:catechol 2,3-dioxygenase-like lactoylglutathione lyase family enzyme
MKRKAYPQFQTSLIFLELNGFRVELIKDDNAKPGTKHPDPPAHTAVTGVAQFCFQTDDLAGVQAQLEQRGVRILFPFQNEDLGVKFLFIRDPEGNLIQFLQRLTSE